MSSGAPLRSAAVLGAGTMGAQIAAHLANAGVPVVLLDVNTEAARDGLKRAAALRPDPFFTKQAAALITTGSLADDLGRIAGADWIVEAIVEQLAIKRELFARIDAVRAAHTIVSSNTSGIPIGALAEGRSEEFRAHFLGTHFFNPPRYLRLVEIIPTADVVGFQIEDNELREHFAAIQAGELAKVPNGAWLTSGSVSAEGEHTRSLNARGCPYFLVISSARADYTLAGVLVRS